MLRGKSVVVTGAGRGLGAAYALACARQGASLVVNDIDGDAAQETTEAISSMGGAAVAEQGNVASAADADRIVERCVREYGRIDGLVNNAGVFRMGVLGDQDEQELRLLVETNVVGTYLCGSTAARRMKAQGSGAIVNITSARMPGSP
jgi:NAD(P)-dependent dehydrogenase (short-subunit alcohol dehydrogenase family)